jgi:hypothetical protein
LPTAFKIVYRLNFFYVIADRGKKFLALSATAFKILFCFKSYFLSTVGDGDKNFFYVIGDSIYKFLAMAATALKSTKRRISSLNHQNL